MRILFDDGSQSNLVLQGPSTVSGISGNKDKLENDSRQASLMNHLLKTVWKVFQHKLHLIFFSPDIKWGYLGSVANQATQIMDCVLDI